MNHGVAGRPWVSLFVPLGRARVTFLIDCLTWEDTGKMQGPVPSTGQIPDTW